MHKAKGHPVLRAAVNARLNSLLGRHIAKRPCIVNGGKYHLACTLASPHSRLCVSRASASLSEVLASAAFATLRLLFPKMSTKAMK